MRRKGQGLNSTKLIRTFNAISILRTLYKEGSSSRTRLTEVTKMSPSTVTRIISELLEQGIITEKGTEESNGGRKPVILQLNFDKLYIVGIQMNRDRVSLALSNLKGKILAKRQFRPYSLEPEELLRELVIEFDKLLKDSPIKKEHILGVGLAISGIVESSKGVLIRSVNLGWRNIKISERLEEMLDFPVVTENDANAAAMAEFWFGGAKDTPNFLYLKTSTGVGAGVVYERNLLTGPRGMAGEIGHIPLKENGRRCRCGQRGCLETYLYQSDVFRRYADETGRTVEDFTELYARARSGDTTAGRILDEAAEALSIAVSFAGGLLDLDMVVIGGEWGALGDEFLDKIRSYNEHVLDRCGLQKNIKIKGSELGQDSDLLGAVGLVINKWFTPPI